MAKQSRQLQAEIHRKALQNVAEADKSQYFADRVNRAEQSIGDALIAHISGDRVDGRVLNAVLSRIWPIPKYSTQVVSNPVNIDISSPEAVENTRADILFRVGRQEMPLDEAKVILEMVNAASDRLVSAQLNALYEVAVKLREEREALLHQSIRASKKMAGGEDEKLPPHMGEQPLETQPTEPEKIMRPTWGRWREEEPVEGIPEPSHPGYDPRTTMPPYEDLPSQVKRPVPKVPDW